MSRDRNGSDWISQGENFCFDFWVTTFWQSLSEEIAQYHQPDSIVLYCWLSAVIYNQGVATHTRSWTIFRGVTSRYFM